MKNPIDHLQRWAPPFAAAVCFLLAGWIWLPQEHGQTGSNVSPASATEIREQNSAKDGLNAGAQQLLERPLFHVSRRPPMAAEQPQAAPVSVTLTLTGVLDSDNDQIALLRLSNSPELLRKRVGETVGEWTILGITKTTVSVQNASGEESLIGLSSASP